jgi:hypothetical protein
MLETSIYYADLLFVVCVEVLLPEPSVISIPIMDAMPKEAGKQPLSPTMKGYRSAGWI